MRLLIFIISLTVTFSVFSQSSSFVKVENANSIIKKLNDASLNTKSIDSDFKQFKHLDILENDIESTGHFSFLASEKVRWEYFTPYKYLIVMNSGNMLINDGHKTQKYDTKSNKMFKEINDLMVGMLQGKILYSDQFKSRFFENKSQILVKLTPLSPDIKEFLNEIELFFDKKDYSVSKIRMNELSGDYTLIKFLNKKLNTQIPTSKFVIK